MICTIANTLPSALELFSASLSKICCCNGSNNSVLEGRKRSNGRRGQESGRGVGGGKESRRRKGSGRKVRVGG